MATREVVRDAPVKPLAPVDESVVVPASVKAAAAAADEIHKRAYPKETPAAAPDKQPDPAPAPDAENPDNSAASVDAKPDAQAVTPAPAPAQTPAPSPDDGGWEHKYNSMHGRWKASQTQVGALQEQMAQMGDELMRLQSMLNQPQTQQPQTQQPTRKLVTEEDVSNYGSDVIDMAKRAATEALAPQIEELQHRNTQLENTLKQTTQKSVYTVLDERVPTWRDVNKDPKFKAWLRLPDIYSRQVRQKLLNDAFEAANAASVVAFFQGYLNDVALTTGTQDVPAPAPAAAQQAPARTAARPLDTLAAPGRAKPASGGNTVPADKPVITRTQITQFYENVRKGAYAGREQQKEIDEQTIFAAQREGRVRG